MTTRARQGGSFGFEASTALSLAASLVLALPGLREFVHESHRSAVVNALQLDLRRASSAAGQLGRAVSLCGRDASGQRCAAGTDWSRGWLAFVDADGDGAMGVREESLVLWAVENSHPDLRLTASDAVIALVPPWSPLAPAGAREVTVCDLSGHGGGRTVALGHGSVPSLETASCR